MLLVFIFVTYDLHQFQMCILKNVIAPFHKFLMPQRVAKTLKTRKIVILAPFSVINSLTEIMQSQTRHKDILARQSEKTPLSTGDNEKVSCLGLHSSVYDFITENGAKMSSF